MDQNNDDRGIDLSHALGDSSSRIKFEGEEFQRPSQSFQNPTPKIVQWVIKYSGGYVKDEQQANYVLIGFVVVAIIFSLFFILVEVMAELNHCHMNKHINYLNNMNSSRNSNSGFTLIELLVVIAIIGILSSVVLASLNSARDKARVVRAASDLKQLNLALLCTLIIMVFILVLTILGMIQKKRIGLHLI